MQYIDLIETPALRALGIPEPWHLGRADRVRFHELDALNHVNNATYFSWFENFRLAYLVRHQLAYHAESAPVLVVKSTGIDYLKPLFLNQDYVVTGRVRSFRRTSFVMDYGVFADGIAARAEAVLVLFEADGVARMEIPDATREAWVAEDGAVSEA